jgi:hypothetical protein
VVSEILANQEIPFSGKEIIKQCVETVADGAFP